MEKCLLIRWRSMCLLNLSDVYGQKLWINLNLGIGGLFIEEQNVAITIKTLKGQI